MFQFNCRPLVVSATLPLDPESLSTRQFAWLEVGANGVPSHAGVQSLIAAGLSTLARARKLHSANRSMLRIIFMFLIVSQPLAIYCIGDLTFV